MDEQKDENLELISGYLDNELAGADRARVEALIDSNPGFRREFEAFKTLSVGTDRVFQMEEPGEEEWEAFLDGVYNRLERRTGWLIFWGGLLALSLYAIVLFYREPWGSALIKFLISLPVAGLAVLFFSVLRQRLLAMKTDRYTKEVHR